MGLPKMKYYRCLIADILACTLIVLAFILLLTKACGAQVYGFNGTNVPENLTPEVRQWVIDMHPVGDTVVMVFRNDKYTDSADITDLINVVSLSNEMTAQGRVFELIYTFNTRGVNLDDNFYGLNYFIQQGVRIRAVRLGNEEYFKAAGHNGLWANYWAYAEPIKDAVYGYGYPILIPIADHLDTKWNPTAASVINSDNLLQPDYHFYLGRNDLDIYRDTNYVKNDALIKRPNTIGYNDFYSTVYAQVTETDFNDVMGWFYDTFPTKKMYVTEYGIAGNPGGMGGTVGFEAANDWFLNVISGYSNIDCLCKFNGPSITGYITPSGKWDLSTEPYIKRLSYFTLSNFYQSRYNLTNGLAESVHNFTSDTVFIEKQGYTATFTGIMGDWDASSGACAWWASNSVKTYEIAGLSVHEFVPPMSYGYITYEPITGCTDRNATNFNPDAIDDDGSCVYPAPPCLRKRVLFTSLPCREVKTKCNCN